jgi:hypothetical protein
VKSFNLCIDPTGYHTVKMPPYSHDIGGRIDEYRIFATQIFCTPSHTMRRSSIVQKHRAVILSCKASLFLLQSRRIGIHRFKGDPIKYFRLDGIFEEFTKLPFPERNLLSDFVCNLA